MDGLESPPALLAPQAARACVIAVRNHWRRPIIDASAQLGCPSRDPPRIPPSSIDERALHFQRRVNGARCPRCQDGAGRHGCPPRCAWARVLARVADVASSELLGFIQATGSHCSLATTSVNLRGPPPMPHAEPGTNGLTGWYHACLEMSRFPEFTQRRKRSKSVQCQFTYEYLCLVCGVINLCAALACAVGWRL